MSDFEPQFNLSRLVAGLDEDLQTQLDFISISQEASVAVSQYLAADLQSIRFNILSDMLSVSDLWKVIRDHSTIADLVLDLTSSLHILAQSQYADGWKQLLRLVADGLGCFNHDAVHEANCTLDNDDERERYVKPETMEDFLESNAWLVTLYLLRRTPTVRKLLGEVAERARLAAAAAAKGK